MTDPIIEAAARALAECGFYDNEAVAAAKTMLAAGTPLIRAQVLEEAAVLVGTWGGHPLIQDTIAAKLRALKEQP